MFVRTISEKKRPQIYKRAIIVLFSLLPLVHPMYHHTPTTLLSDSRSLLLICCSKYSLIVLTEMVQPKIFLPETYREDSWK